MTAGSIAETTAAVRAGDLTVTDEVTRRLERCRVAQPSLNLFTHLDPEAALSRARDLDARIRAGEDIGPLGGVTVALKDMIDQRGVVTTAGSSFYRAVAEESAAVVVRLESAGAVILGRVGLGEFAFDYTSENHWFGPVRNPWDPATSPGGSSGGSGAAVAAGAVSLALGTDTGGSVRVPAALCGVVGLRPTHGRIPLAGVFPQTPSLDTVGPLATTIADIDTAFRVLAGLAMRSGSGPRPRDPRPVSIGIPHPWIDFPLSAEVGRAFEWALEKLGDWGARIIELDVPVLDPGQEPPHRGRWAEIADIHREWFTADPSAYSPDMADKLGQLMELTAEQRLESNRWRDRMRAGADRVFADVDMLALPTVPITKKVIGQDEVEIGGIRVPHHVAFARFTVLASLIGATALAAPIAVPGSPPPSLQLVGPAGAEARLLEVGGALEREGILGFRGSPVL